MMKSMTSIVKHLPNLQTEKTSGSFTHQSSGSPINPEVGINMIPVRVPQTPARQPDKLPYRWTVMLQTVVEDQTKWKKNNCARTNGKSFNGHYRTQQQY